jgi:hypothetical protein
VVGFCVLILNRSVVGLKWRLMFYILSDGALEKRSAGKTILPSFSIIRLAFRLQPSVLFFFVQLTLRLRPSVPFVFIHLTLRLRPTT